jgi:diketogulonate reductase-like aldo/keto reductase
VHELTRSANGWPGRPEMADHGAGRSGGCYEKSAGKLGVDQIDLLILHQALPSDFDKNTSTLQDPVIGEIAQAHDKTVAQVMLRWHLQQGRSAIPKSTKPQRIAENFDVFDFELTGEQLEAIDGLDTGTRGGPEPADITMATFGMPIPEA